MKIKIFRHVHEAFSSVKIPWVFFFFNLRLEDSKLSGSDHVEAMEKEVTITCAFFFAE